MLIMFTNTIGSRNSLVGRADKIIWLYSGLADSKFNGNSIYSIKLDIL